MPEPFVRITALGGLGEIGLNCQIWESAAGAVVVDCGLMFPDDLQLGIDVVIPPLEPILALRENLLGVVLTHGHEDHIGAVPWLVSVVAGLRIYGSPFTLALLEHKLRERGLAGRAGLTPVAPGDVVALGDFRFHFLPVSHSIPQGYGLVVHSPAGSIVHTGDFKLDVPSIGGMGTNPELFRNIAGRDGVRLLLSDSTNVEIAGHSRPEGVVRESLRDIFAAARGRILITLFSSHIERIRSVFETAAEFGRVVIVSGRSLANNIELAREHGLLPHSPAWHSDQAVPELAPERLVILATGSQGEPLSALARITTGGHRFLSIREGDTVIMSSRAIAGNAPAINRLINQMYRQGASVLHEGVHVTGHAQREELRLMLNTLRPELFVPIHGEFRHMARHRDLARECAMPAGNILLLENGQPLVLYPDRFALEEKIPTDCLLVDGKGVGDVDAPVLRERRLLGGEGVVAVFLVLDAAHGDVLYGPEIVSRGFAFAPESGDMLEEAGRLVRVQLMDRAANEDPGRLGDRVRSSLRGFFRRTMGRDPVVLPVIARI
jgi:ribonuclease J